MTNHAAGKPVPKVINPRMRNVQAGPSLSSSLSMAMAVTAPPRPPAALRMPLAIPRFLLKYWAVVVDAVMKHMLEHEQSAEYVDMRR